MNTAAVTAVVQEVRSLAGVFINLNHEALLSHQSQIDEAQLTFKPVALFGNVPFEVSRDRT
jgi:hypothetical protein